MYNLHKTKSDDDIYTSRSSSTLEITPPSVFLSLLENSQKPYYYSYLDLATKLFLISSKLSKMFPQLKWRM
jgi:hypothetical protein